MSKMKALAFSLSMALLFSGGVHAYEASADSGIGGGTAFTNGTIFPFIAGLESSIQSSFFVQNIGEEPMELELSHGAPRGITIEPVEGQSTSLAAASSTIFNFKITVDEAVPANDYPVLLNLRQANLEPDDGEGSVYRPALSASFVVSVVGASATVNFSAISALNGSPAIGDLSLFYLGANGIDTLIFETTGSDYQVDVVPGNYRASFDVPNLQRQSLEFSISEGEVKDLVLEIPTLEILTVGAIPTRDDRDVIQLISLSMDVYNNLRPLEGPIDFVSRVYFEGELVDEFVIETIPVLPEGATLQRATYDRPDGFDSGRWTFEFAIGNSDFEVVAPQTLDIQSPGLLQSFLSEFLLGLAILVIAGLLAPRRWWAFILRRRKKNDDEISSDAKPEMVTVQRLRSRTTRPKKPKVEKVSPDKKPSPVKLPAVEKSQSIANKVAKEPLKRTRKPVKAKSLDAANSPAKTNDAAISIFAKAKEFFATAVKLKESDPYQLVLKTVKELDELESQGLRTLKLTYDMDAIFAKNADMVIKRSSGSAYSDEELALITRYEKAKDKLTKIDRPDLERQARSQLINDRIWAGKKSGAVND